MVRPLVSRAPERLNESFVRGRGLRAGIENGACERMRGESKHGLMGHRAEKPVASVTIDFSS